MKTWKFGLGKFGLGKFGLGKFGFGDGLEDRELTGDKMGNFINRRKSTVTHLKRHLPEARQNWSSLKSNALRKNWSRWLWHVNLCGKSFENILI